METQECSICNKNEFELIFKISNYPAFIVPIPKEVAQNVVKDELPLHMCRSCGHLQVLNPDPNIQQLIYEEYYSYYQVDTSESFIPHYRDPFVQFFKKLKENGVFESKSSLLEIGCSSGRQVSFFREYVDEYTGIDPSDRIEIAIKDFPTENFVKGYFPDDLGSQKFDIAVSQFNLEHILDVRTFMHCIYEKLNDGGLVIIQVPDIEDFERNKTPNFLAHEHIQYFTLSTLTHLLNKSGFDVLDSGETGPSLIMAGIKNEKNISSSFSGLNHDALSNSLQSNFDNFPQDLPNRIIFYGVGPQLYWLASQNKNALDDCAVVDDNPGYEGMALPGYQINIQKPGTDLFRNYDDVVLSLNRIYHKVVLDKIKSLGIRINVHYLDETGMWKINKFEEDGISDK